ncbi:MAG: hypothetical protein DLM56_01670 [Pseudonocardiales bacterium]|nr:MAG: hypothetical protein DLM56_01670 [Pseudonocardiales bacterium]
MSATTITIVGNIVDRPEMRRLDGDVDVVNFRVASTARRFDRTSGQWVDASSLFVRVVCWRALASNVATSMQKGDPVIVTGRLQTRRFVQNDQPQSREELEATAVGPDLARGTAQFVRSRSAEAIHGAAPVEAGAAPGVGEAGVAA